MKWKARIKESQTAVLIMPSAFNIVKIPPLSEDSDIYTAGSELQKYTISCYSHSSLSFVPMEEAREVWYMHAVSSSNLAVWGVCIHQ